MMKRSIFLTIFAAFLLNACSTPEGPVNPPAPEPAFKSARVESGDNAMIAKVTAEFGSSCEWAVEYWTKGAGQTAAKLTSYRSSEDAVAVLKFLDPSTAYECRVLVKDGEPQAEIMEFTTPDLPENLPVYTVDYTSESYNPGGYVMQMDDEAGWISFCTMEGKIVWYHNFGRPVRVAHFNPQLGLLSALVGYKELADKDINRLCDEVVVMDLDYNVILDKKTTSGFAELAHNDISINDKGELIVLSNYVKNYQGADYWGEEIGLYDTNGAKKFLWNNFDEFNPEKDTWYTNDPAGCDYIHMNSVDMDADGDYYAAVNLLTEIWKIDGKTGAVLYRIGEHGDIALTGTPAPVGKSDLSPTALPLNGLHSVTALDKDRVLFLNYGQSKRKTLAAMVYKVDPTSKTAYYEMLVDVPKDYYAQNRSSVQLLPDGNFMLCSTGKCKVVFFSADGTLLHVISHDKNVYGLSYRASWVPADTPAFN